MNNRARLILEMLNRADMRLQAQQQIAIAADARAMQLVAVLIASAAVTMAVAGDGVAVIKWVVVVPLILASACGIYAARPVEWHAPGMRPSAFTDDVNGDRDHEEVMLELAGHLESSIAENNRTLSENAKWMRFAAKVAILAPILGATVSMFS